MTGRELRHWRIAKAAAWILTVSVLAALMLLSGCAVLDVADGSTAKRACYRAAYTHAALSACQSRFPVPAGPSARDWLSDPLQTAERARARNQAESSGVLEP